MSFSEAEQDQLINIVSKHPVLYDVGHPSYRNSLAKEIVWQSIGKELDKNTEDCKKKWKFIRDGYHRFKKRRKVGIPAPKNSKDQRHQQLLFLDNVFHPRSGGSKFESDIPMSPQDLTEVKVESYQSEEHVLVGESADAVLSIDNKTHKNDNNVTETLNAESEEQTESKETRRKRNNNEDELLKAWKERETLLKLTLEKRDDDVELFCRHIAEVLRNLPPVEKAEAKKHLGLVLSDYEIKAARNASSTQRSLPMSHYTYSSDFHAATSSSEYPSSMPANAYNLPGASNAPQFANVNVSYTSGQVQYNTSDACSSNSAMSTSPEPTEYSYQIKQESEELKEL